MNLSKNVRLISNLNPQKITYEREFWLFGEPLLFRTNSNILLEAAEETFCRFQKNINTETNPLVITLVVTEGKKQSTGNRLREPSFHTIGEIFFITLDQYNVAVADITAGSAFGFLTTSIVREKSYVRYNIIEALSQAMLGPSRNYLHIHAACVRKNDISLILQGNAGSGKSTLAYACVRNGYQLLAEDVVHIKFNRDEIKLWGAPWKFHLLPDAKRHFPELKSINPSLQMNGEWKLELDIDDHHPGSAITNTVPGPVIKIIRDTQFPVSLQKISRDEAIDEIEFLWPWTVGWSDEHEFAAKRIITNGMYHLYTGNSIVEPIKLMDKLVRDLGNSEK